MSRDGLFFKAAGRLSPKSHRHPSSASGSSGSWTCLLCLSGSYGQLLDYVIFAVLLFYILTIVALFVLRRTRPDADRPYRAIRLSGAARALYIVMASVHQCCTLALQTPIHVAGPADRSARPACLLCLAPFGQYLSQRSKDNDGASVREEVDGITDERGPRRGNSLARAFARPRLAHHARHRCRHRCGYLRALRARVRTPPAPSLMLAFVLSGLGCAFAGLCYAEFAAMIPTRRLRLHLRLRHPGRAVRLDHRLGPHA